MDDYFFSRVFGLLSGVWVVALILSLLAIVFVCVCVCVLACMYACVRVARIQAQYVNDYFCLQYQIFVSRF